MQKKVKFSSARIACFDIESTNLNGNFGYILCISWKWVGEDKIHTVKISDSPDFKLDCTNDKWVVQKAAEELSKADMWVTWYGAKFDVPMIQTRLLAHGLMPMPDVPHFDGWRIAKYKMKLNSNRLATVTGFLGHEPKTPLDGRTWVLAMAGNKKALRYIVEHCEQDVRVLEQVYHTIKPLATNHPNINLVSGEGGRCPTCGSDKIQKRGSRISSTSVSQRYHCRACGSWSHGPSESLGITIR